MTLAISFLVVLLLWRDAERARHRAKGRLRGGPHGPRRDPRPGERSIEPTVVVSRDRFITSLDSTRTRILELARRRPDDLAVWKMLAVVDLFLGRNLEFQGRLVEGRSALLRVPEVLGPDHREVPRPDRPEVPTMADPPVPGTYLRAAGEAGTRGLPFWEHAVAAGESLLPAPVPAGFQYDGRVPDGPARSLERRGDHRRARGLLVANVAMLRDVPPDARYPFQVEELRRAWEDLLARAGNPRPRPERSGAKPCLGLSADEPRGRPAGCDDRVRGGIPAAMPIRGHRRGAMPRGPSR